MDFSDLTPGSQCSFNCTIYCPVHFHALRQVYLDSERSYVQSLAFVRDWKASGGASGASFFQTEDERFVIKAISKHEFIMFLKSALAYFRHMHEALLEDYYSMLVKILGVYKVVVSSPSRKTTKYLIVMENLFHGRKIPRHLVFDLKGKERRNRKATATNSQVRLDTDLFDYTRGYPLPLTEPAKRWVNFSVLNDTEFLSEINVMDYSILVGIDEANAEIVIGIIDYVRSRCCPTSCVAFCHRSCPCQIRRFDLVKEWEFRVKNLTQNEPTVVQPDR